jgi:hypothetical protein
MTTPAVLPASATTATAVLRQPSATTATAPAATNLTVPPTLLPTDPSLLVHYLRSQYLADLQQVYATQLLAHQSASSSRPGGLKNRRNSSSANHSKRRRQSSPATASREEEAQTALLDEETTLWDSRRAAFNNGLPIDGAHIYSLGYVLEPEGSADVYYHGPFPLPPKKITRALMGETRLLVDFKGVENKLVWETANPLFRESMNPSSFVNDKVIASRNMMSNGEMGDTMSESIKANIPIPLTTEEWEMEAIAKFSNSCDARIAISSNSNSSGSSPLLGDKLEMSNERERENRMGSQQQQQQQYGQNPNHWR